mgnify:FL=1
MKKNVKKILFLILLFFVILFCNTIVNAASFSASASKTTLTKGSTATLTITASDCAGKFSITSSDSNVVSISSSSEWVESGSKSITITAKKEGTAKITVKAADVSDSSANVVSGSKSISITVKDTTSNNNSNSNSNNSNNSNSNNNSGNNGNNNNNPTPSEPTFTSTNETVYAKSKANIRSSYSTSSTKVGSLSEGDSVTRIGIGNNGWSKITYNGQTAYISTSLLTKTKPEENNSKPNETTDNTTNNSEKNNDKPEETILQLDELKIENYELTPEFSKDIYEYKVNIDENIEKLNIEPISNDKDITIEVKGNENLKIGDNLITITLKKDGVEEKTYNITVTKKENVKEETVTKINQDLLNQEIEQINKNLKIRQWTIRGIIIFVTILIIIIIILRYITVRNETEEYFNNDYINIRDKFNELNNNIDNEKEDIKINNNVENEDEKDIDEVKQSKIQNQNENEDAETQIQEDDDVKPKRNKRSKGKHF